MGSEMCIRDRGEVMGSNTAASSGGAPEGFAVPIQQAVSIADQIKAGKTNGTVRVGPKAVLGVQVGPSNRAGTSNLPGRDRDSAPQGDGTSGASGASGAVVQAVTDSSAAAAAGITEGSTITAVDGTPVADGAVSVNAASGRGAIAPGRPAPATGIFFRLPIGFRSLCCAGAPFLTGSGGSLPAADLSTDRQYDAAAGRQQQLSATELSARRCRALSTCIPTVSGPAARWLRQNSPTTGLSRLSAGAGR